MPIGEFASRSGLSPKRLRTYATAGLLVPAAVDSDTGYRYYAPGQLHDAAVIDALRRADVPLSAIGDLLHGRTSFDFQRWTDELEHRSTARRAALEQARELLACAADPPLMEAPMPTTLTPASSRTERGRDRTHNQDVAFASDLLVGVADGMGGGPRGDLAASTAAAVVTAGFTGEAASELRAVVRAANAAVFERAASDTRLGGMGTTLCCAGLVSDGSVVVANVGDSRAYLVRDGDLRRITRDHTITAELVRSGQVPEQDAADHPLRHVLTRVLGAGPSLDVDLVTLDVYAGDVLVLCTDGLSGVLGDEAIAAAVATEGPPSAIADHLVTLAIDRGSTDDVTVVVAAVAVR
jgi:protein phosphatase